MADRRQREDRWRAALAVKRLYRPDSGALGTGSPERSRRNRRFGATPTAAVLMYTGCISC